MKKVAMMAVAFLALSNPAPAASFKGFLKVTFTGNSGRWIAGAAGCAASLLDQQTTFYGRSIGAVEQNPLYYSNGNFHTNRFIAIKVGTCAAIAGEEIWVRWIAKTPQSKLAANTTFTMINWVGAGIRGNQVRKNWDVIHRIEDRNATTQTPDPR